MGSGAVVTASAVSVEKKKSKKKRAASHLDDRATSDHNEAVDGVLVEDDDSLEPTIGEKLESLELKEGATKGGEDQELVPGEKPPSADSVNILLKQALHADDRSLLLDCLYTQDEKVIAKSISTLSMADVLELLHSLVTIIEARGAVVACAIPWLRSLLLQHASGIMSQESSFRSLNSLNQVIDSRVSTFQSALQLSSHIDSLYAGIVDDSLEEDEPIVSIIYEDNDESDDEQEDDAMETDDEDSDQNEPLDGLIESEDSEGMDD
ncbi:unnamed protein product [Linum tenue]|uniref:Small-subunit processome Utp12 domain-containing protein n=1 Tax=Linum tenue TaxID=586396 RepID=A0AAV0KMA2_9ROSI|nr:unnamed protein product [Linum tenue]